MNLKKLFLESKSPLIGILPQLDWYIHTTQSVYRGWKNAWRADDLPSYAKEMKLLGFTSIAPTNTIISTAISGHSNPSFFEPLNQYYHPEPQEKELTFHVDDDFTYDSPLRYELSADGARGHRVDVGFRVQTTNDIKSLHLTAEERRWIISFYHGILSTVNKLMGAAT